MLTNWIISVLKESKFNSLKVQRLLEDLKNNVLSSLKYIERDALLLIMSEKQKLNKSVVNYSFDIESNNVNRHEDVKWFISFKLIMWLLKP